MAEKIVKTDAEWRSKLSPEQFHITRKAGTERLLVLRRAFVPLPDKVRIRHVVAQFL